MKQRIYLVKGAHDLHLVRGPSRAAALTFVAQKTLKVELADQDTLVELLTKGYEVHEAREEQAPLPLDDGLCARCSGKGEVHVDGEDQTCPACNGIGLKTGASNAAAA